MIDCPFCDEKDFRDLSELRYHLLEECLEFVLTDTPVHVTEQAEEGTDGTD